MDLARFQRAPEGSHQSATSGRNHVIKRGRVWLGNLCTHLVMGCHRSVNTEAHRLGFGWQIAQTQRLSLLKTSSSLLRLAVSVISFHTPPTEKNLMCGGQMPFCKIILVFIRDLIVSRAKLSLELLALRHQLVVLRRTVQRPQIQNRDRWFWIVVSRIWKDWRQALVIVQPETVIKWHRQGFKRYWRWKSRSRQVGRPKLEKEIRNLICRISDENPRLLSPIKNSPFLAKKFADTS